MNSQIERYRYIAALKPERLNHSREEHEKILKLIKARNLEKATECLREHIHNVRDSVISVCEKQMNKVL
jgi:DNA-binding GntR family transcriptional regulator